MSLLLAFLPQRCPASDGNDGLTYFTDILGFNVQVDGHPRRAVLVDLLALINRLPHLRAVVTSKGSARS